MELGVREVGEYFDQVGSRCFPFVKLWSCGDDDDYDDDDDDDDDVLAH